MSSEQTDTQEADAQLRQFDVLWSQIARRSDAQQTLVGLSVTVTGTVGGLVVSDKADPVLLVVLAVVGPVLGLLWVDHARNIGEIAKFIRRNWTWSPNWELHSELEKREAKPRFVLFVLAMALTFLGPAVAGLIASGAEAHTCAQWTGWVGALALTFLFFIALVDQILRSYPSGNLD